VAAEPSAGATPTAIAQAPVSVTLTPVPTATPVITKFVSSHERLPRPEAVVQVADSDSGDIPLPVTYEAKDASIYGDLSVMPDGGVGRFEQKNPEDKLEFIINIEKEGFYELNFEAISFGGHKENNFSLDGSPAGVFINEGADYEAASMQHVYLEVGEHAAALTASWGWIAIKSMTVSYETSLETVTYRVPIELVSPNADDDALALMSFLAENYGKTSLAGQQSQGNWGNDHGLFGGESQFVFNRTGKRPAVIGLDFIDYSPSRVSHGRKSTEVEAAFEAWENNAIVTFCWHWNAPEP
jgi:mannan endo-1,4-beta-mannosidase